MASDDLGFTPLISASMAGDVATVRELIARGADVNARAYDGWSAVHAAALVGSAEILEVLIEAGARVDEIYTRVDDEARETSDPWVAASFAAASGHRDALAVLLAHRAPMSARDAAHFVYAVLRREGYRLRLICRFDPGENPGDGGSRPRQEEAWWTGAPITLPREDTDLVHKHIEVRTRRGFSALNGAVVDEPQLRFRDYAFIATTSVETTEATFTGLDEALLSPALFGHVEGTAALPVAERSRLLRRAIVRRQREIIRVLLRDTPPDFANDAVAVPDIFDLLLEAGIQPSPALMTSAIQSGQLESVRLLLDRGFTGDKLTEMDAIACAAATTNVEVLQLLIRHGARFKEPGALHRAAHGGGDRALATVHLLLMHGASPNRTTERRGPLFDAILSEDSRIVLRLLEERADANERDEDDNTPLHYATRTYRGPAIVNLLLRAGANRNALNKKKQSPYQGAVICNNYVIMKVLASAGPTEPIARRSPRLRLSPHEIRALGCHWPPDGWGETAYAMADGRVDLEECRAAALRDVTHHTSQATAGRWFASQAARVSFDDYEDFRDNAREDEGRAHSAKKTLAEVEALIACVRGKPRGVTP